MAKMVAERWTGNKGGVDRAFMTFPTPFGHENYGV